MKCTECEDGKMTIEMFEGFPRKGEEGTKTEIDCVICDGTGEIDEETAEMVEFEKNMWCECGNPSEDVDFYDDGEHPEISKHHYRCRDCGAVVQIG